MCGICGMITASGSVADLAQVRRMAGTIAHRGPDAEGFWADGPAALGHRRLSIIDLSPAGAQPMTNEDGSLRVVFNGEIYNFLELRAALEKKGHRFTSRTDTEVILHQYEEDGERCVEKFRGMFSFALWDAPRRRLFAARDRVGKKPFLYSTHGGVLRFASEMQALAACPEIPRRVDPDALDAFLHYQYVPSPMTIFKEVRKLPPAHTLTWENGDLKVAPYWQLDYRLKDGWVDSREAEERFLELFDEAVKLRLVSDVPLGAFLSGGVDSSAVVEAMTRLSGRAVKTFSIGFDEAAYTELPYAREVSDLFHSDHRELLVRPNALEILPALARHYGEPYADSSAIPTYCVAKLARERVTVGLAGDGGDESFLGYPRVAAIEVAGLLTKLPRPVRAAMSAAAALLPAGTSTRSLTRRVKRFLSFDGRSPEAHFTELVAYFGSARRRALYTPEFAASISGDAAAWMHRLFQDSLATNLTEKALATEARSYLPDDLMVKTDIASMMNSLEIRAPFLDHVLMEFAARLPLRFKKQGLSTKTFLKRALAARLPHGILHRQKQGFGVPLEAWFRGALKGPARERLLSPKAWGRGYFKAEEVKRLLDEHEAGVDHSNRLWALMFFEEWGDCYLKG